MAFNFVSAIGIVIANKAVFRSGFLFPTCLTGLHFFSTALGVRICHICGMYDIKPLRQAQVCHELLH